MAVLKGLDSKFAQTPGYSDLVQRFKKSLAADLAFLRDDSKGVAATDINRRIHKLKGAAYMLGFDLLGDLAAHCERDEEHMPGLILAIELIVDAEP